MSCLECQDNPEFISQLDDGSPSECRSCGGAKKREKAASVGFEEWLDLQDWSKASFDINDRLNVNLIGYGWQAARVSADKEIRDLKDENKVLRELVLKMWGAKNE